RRDHRRLATVTGRPAARYGVHAAGRHQPAGRPLRRPAELTVGGTRRLGAEPPDLAEHDVVRPLREHVSERPHRPGTRNLSQLGHLRWDRASRRWLQLLTPPTRAVMREIPGLSLVVAGRGDPQAAVAVRGHGLDPIGRESVANPRPA